jgi:hypothetical protein
MEAIGSALVQEEMRWLLTHPRTTERAWGHNYAFDETVSRERQARFEREVEDFPSSPDFDPALNDGHVLIQGHGSYHARWIDTATEPETFADDNRSAAFQGIEETDWLVRLENLGGPLSRWGGSFDDLSRAFGTGGARTPDDMAALKDFLEAWNRHPVRAPRFAAFASELATDLRAGNWADRLRTRLGMSRLSPPAGGTIPVALMAYRVTDVLAAVRGRRGVAHVFCRPTALDQPPYEYFFSGPVDLEGGRCMPLSRPRADSPLVCELLHPRFAYRIDHIFNLGEVTTAKPTWSLRDLRNSHLGRLRDAAGRPDFGELIPDDVDDD